jgi:hypothetical protein
MKTKTLVLPVLLVLGFVGLEGCASTQKAKAGAYQGLFAAKEALNLVSNTLLAVECTKPTAPLPPACVPPEAADKAWKAIGVAADKGQQATGLVRALPPSLDSSTPPAEVASLVGEIWATIWDITNLFHHPAATSLNKQLTTLSHE